MVWKLLAIFSVLGLLLCGAGGLFLWNLFPTKTTEILRVPNPSRTVDAVVLSDYGDEGALGYSQGYRVLLVSHGKPAEENGGNLVLRFDAPEGYGPKGDWRPEWPADDKLLLRFKHTHVTAYNNEPWAIGDRFVGVQLQTLYYGGHWPDERASLPGAANYSTPGTR